MELIEAVQSYNFEHLRELLAVPGVEVDYVNEAGRTALFIAMEKNAVSCANLLLNSKANINSVDNEGNTPIFGAVWFNNMEALKLCMSRSDCNFNVINSYGQTPLLNAVRRAWVPGVEVLVANPNVDVNAGHFANEGGDVNPLILAADLNYAACLEKLLQSPKIEVNSQRSGNGDTALISAVWRNCTECVYLLAHHPNIDVTIHESRTPLQLAQEQFQSEGDAFARVLEIMQSVASK